jgi:hypothetical protein
MKRSFSPMPVKNPDEITIKQIRFSLYERLENIIERREFVEEATRFKEPPLMYTEECVAPGSRIDLL